MPKKLKTILIAIVIVIAIGVFGLTVYNDVKDLFKMEDTNGPDNYQLQYITDYDILNMKYGSIGTPHVRDEVVGSDVVISSNKFTGIYDVFYTNYIGKSDFVLDLSQFTVESGNMKAVIILDDVIVDEIDFNNEDILFTEYRLEDIKGTLHFRIAGENANFKMKMSKSFYEDFAKMK